MPQKTPDDESERIRIDESDPRIARWAAITELAVTECRSLEQARLWMNTPKVALRGKTPIEAMTTTSGCDAVEVLLRQLNE